MLLLCSVDTMWKGGLVMLVGHCGLLSVLKPMNFWGFVRQLNRRSIDVIHIGILFYIYANFADKFSRKNFCGCVYLLSLTSCSVNLVEGLPLVT